MEDEYFFISETIKVLEKQKEELEKHMEITPDIFNNPFQSTNRHYQNAVYHLGQTIKNLEDNRENIRRILYNDK